MSNFSKPKQLDYDLIIIGSGGAGAVAAQQVAENGKKVCLVESDKLGGDSPNYGVIPTKALLEAATGLKTIQNSHKLGLRVSAVSFNYRSVQAFKDQAIESTGVKNESRVFKASGITTIHGHAHFVNPWTINVGIKQVSANKFLLATGGEPTIPQIDGLQDVGFITYKQATHLNKPPKSLFIIGGGATAYEYAQIFTEFGTKVYLAEVKDHLLPKEDPEIGDSAEAALNELGVRVYTSAKITELSGSRGRKIIALDQHGHQHRINAEEILVACGKSPSLDMGLDNAGVNYSAGGISVNKQMQTNQKHIYAAGEVTGLVESVHGAIQQASIAAHNLYAKKKIAMDYRAIPRVVYGIPEIAMTGLTEHQMIRDGALYQTAIAPISLVGKSMTTNYTSGFVKILATHSGILLGASIVAPNASEMIGELNFAIQHHHHACAITKTVHATPTWSEAIRVAASKIQCI